MVLPFVFLLKIHSKELARKKAQELASLWGRMIFKSVPIWSYTLHNKKNLTEASKVYVANHQSMTDIWAMFLVIENFCWLSKDTYFKVPFVGQAMRLAGFVPVSRKNPKSRKLAFETCRKRIVEGTSLFFFPEGTRSKDAKLKPFFKGAFKLSIEADVEIAPIWLEGAGKLLAKGSLEPKKAHIDIYALAPMKAKEDENAEAFAKRCYDEMLEFSLKARQN